MQGRPLPKSFRVKAWMYVAAVVFNVLVFIAIGWVYVSSNSNYNKKLFDENVRNVANLNIASANAADTYTRAMGIKISDIVQYAEKRTLSYDELVKFIEDSNTNPNWQLQLVLSGTYGNTGKLSYGDYSGISIRKVKKELGILETHTTAIKYGSGYYDILRSFTNVDDNNVQGVCFVPEFTDPDTKLKCFAVYRHVVVPDAAGRNLLYTILLAVNSQKALSTYDVQIEYEGQSSVLVNPNGDYIIKNNDFRNANFYDYLVNYNGLTLDWKDKLKRKISVETAVAGTTSNLFYKNHQGEDCLFSVTSTKGGWNSITCVPIESFHLKTDAMNYTLIVLLLFLLLFVVDGFAIYYIGWVMKQNIAIAEQATQAANEASQAKSRFLSTMSHELRTPLNAIIGFVSLSRDRLGDIPVLSDYLKKIEISSKLLLQIISDILDISAIESSKMKLNNVEFDLTKIISSLSTIYFDQCSNKGIAFNVVLKDMHSELMVGDAVRINQILLNFLSNAVKFTPSGGKVTLKVEQVARKDSGIIIRFDVIDTGCGINSELRNRLFQPFERAVGEESRKYNGTGLGLSIAKNLAELMQGRVGVESTVGVGSDFWVEIPFGVPAARVRKSFSQIENLHVLVAVSDENERDYIGQILEGFNIAFTLVDTAAGALEKLHGRQDSDNPFNLCIVDWKLSDLNGVAAVQKIRSEYDEKALRIIILAYNYAEANTQSASIADIVVIGKPVFPSMLYNSLEGIAYNKERVIPEPEETIDMTGRCVLLVEDNMMNTELARELLHKVGLEVDTAEDGKIGYEKFVASAPGHYDAILMDIQMPVMDGYQATMAIRASEHPQAKTVPILAMTADAFAEDVEKSRVAGMNEHISKPVVPENLFKILKNYLYTDKKE